MSLRPATFAPLAALVLCSLNVPESSADDASSLVVESATRSDAAAVADRVDLHRRAARILEEQRELDHTGWEDARLGEPMAFLRPGIDGPAYVEYPVFGPAGEARGFLMLSTGEHDAPLVHAAHHGESPSGRLQAMANGVELELYRLGHTYVAQDHGGNLIGHVGELPMKMVGYDDSWLTLEDGDRAGSTRWSAEQGLRERESDVGRNIRFVAWGDWAQIRDEYASNRAPLLERDRLAAADDWSVERLMEESGEVLASNEFREIPILGRGEARVEVTGEGSEFVEVVTAPRGIEGDGAVRVFVVDPPAGKVLPVDVEIAYEDGSRETIRLNVTDDIPPGVFAAYPPKASGASVTVRVDIIASRGLECKKVVYRSDGDEYLRVDGTRLRADGRGLSHASTFAVDHIGGGRVHLKAETGKWVQAAGGGGGEVKVDAPAPVANAIFRAFVPVRDKDFVGLLAKDRRHVLAPKWGDIKAEQTNTRKSKFEMSCEPKRISSHYASGSFDSAWENVRRYRQLEPHEAPSRSQCSSGCAATAWASLFGYHDVEAANGVTKWKNLKGLYRKDGSTSGDSNVVAPRTMKATDDTSDMGPKNIVWELAQDMNDAVLAGCAPNGEKWTAPILMGRAHKYLQRRVTGVTLGSDYDGAMLFTDEGKKKVKRIIQNLDQPAVIGISDPHHYPVAIGWEGTDYRLWDRDKKQFKPNKRRNNFVVYMGHQQDWTDLVPYDSWMQGWLRTGPDSASNEVVKAKQKPKVHQTDKDLNPTPKQQHPLPTPKGLEKKKPQKVHQLPKGKNLQPIPKKHNKPLGKPW